MNKYEKQWIEVQERSHEISDLKKHLLDLEVQGMWNSLFKNKINLRKDLFFDMICMVSSLPEPFASWLKEEIIPYLNQKELLVCILIALTYQIYANSNYKFIIMGSLKLLNLVSDIYYDEDNKVYNLTCLSGIQYQIQNVSETKEFANKCNGRCHSITEKMIDSLKESGESIANFSYMGILYYDLFNNPQYHHCIVRNIDDSIIDFAHNIFSDTALYKDELGYEILYEDSVKKVEEKISKLKAVDSDFRESPKIDILKYAMYKHHC